MSRVLMVASEATPFCKTGGLADVVGALPAALREIGEEVAVVLPSYLDIKFAVTPREVWRDLAITVGPWDFNTDIYRAEQGGVPFYFVDCPELYGRHGIYSGRAGDFPDNHLRYAVLSLAALGVVRHLFRPQVVHCHDWQAALAPVYMRTSYAGDPTFMGIRTMLTIHNLGYQGRFLGGTMEELGLDPALFNPEGMEFFGDVNFLKGGIAFSDSITTVSRKYAEEMQTPEYGFGLDGILRARADRIQGIVNGVDYAEWNPETDRHIARNYSADDFSGKVECKRALIAEMGLPAEAMGRPLIGIVSRFAEQKGFELVEEIGQAIAEEDVSVAILGSGEARFEDAFRYFAWARPDKFAARIGYDDGLAHRIEAGADLFLMPSRYEPCGLNQIYSLRYGTPPVVRATGGLDDTIEDGTGFKFQEYSGAALLGAIRNALEAYRDAEGWAARMRRGMKKDFSWKVSAGEYANLYRRLTESR